MNPGLSDAWKKQEQQNLSYLPGIIKLNTPLGLHELLWSKKCHVPLLGLTDAVDFTHA
jgi:hypothetical protein